MWAESLSNVTMQRRPIFTARNLVFVVFWIHTWRISSYVPCYDQLLRRNDAGHRIRSVVTVNELLKKNATLNQPKFNRFPPTP
jgi:hypothetical protein